MSNWEPFQFFLSIIINRIKLHCICFFLAGFMGVYKGVTATIMKQGSNQAIRFYVMETLKDVYKGDDPKKPVPKLMVGAFGAVAGAASVFGNTPIDVVKTRNARTWSIEIQEYGRLCIENLAKWRTARILQRNGASIESCLSWCSHHLHDLRFIHGFIQ